MKNKIKVYIEDLFEQAPVSRRVIELKEEIYTNAIERFDDLIAENMSEEDAYKLVINSVGDIKSLLASIEIEEEKERMEQTPNKKYAMMKTLSVALYIFAGIMYLLAGTYMDSWVEAIIITLMVLIFPICISVYTTTMTKGYQRQDESVVEAFKEWNSEKQNSKAIRGAISVIIWSLTLIAYFLISFLTGAWYISWLVFVVAVCIEAIASLLFSMKK